MGVEKEKIKILIWGTGIRSEKASSIIDRDKYEVLAYVDSNVLKQGTIFCDKEIISPDKINNYNFDKILIFSVAFNEISQILIEKYTVPKEKIDNVYYFAKQGMVQYYENNESENSEISEIIQTIKNNPLQVFNYKFCEKYIEKTDTIVFDEDNKMFYVMHMGKKMYFNRKFDTVEKVATYYKSIQIEQDELSPHKYLTDGFDINLGDIVVDAGVAEGNFALEIIDKVKRIYLIECDENWLEALKLTFAPYGDKVIFVNKFLGNMDDEKSITLNSLLKDSDINFIKMDIEGAEYSALIGANIILEQKHRLKLAICAYHNTEDEKNILSLLQSYNISGYTTNGYMVFLDKDNYLELDEPLRLRRGLVKAFIGL